MSLPPASQATRVPMLPLEKAGERCHFFVCQNLHENLHLACLHLQRLSDAQQNECTSSAIASVRCVTLQAMELDKRVVIDDVPTSSKGFLPTLAAAHHSR